jgi:hypothetical protein
MVSYADQGCQILLMKYTKTGENLPNYHYVNYQMASKYAKWPKYIPDGHKIYQHLSLQDIPKFTQIWIFVRKYTVWQP